MAWSCVLAGSVEQNYEKLFPHFFSKIKQNTTFERFKRGAEDGCGRAEGVLGRSGCGLSFFLASELKPGMRWHRVLLCMSHDRRGLPVKASNPSIPEMPCQQALEERPTVLMLAGQAPLFRHTVTPIY